MKGLLITVIVILVLALIGWIGFSEYGSTSVISIDRQEIKDDTQEAARDLTEAGKRAMEATREAAVGAARELDDPDDEAPPPQPAP
jgi:hypothetical protein